MSMPISRRLARIVIPGFIALAGPALAARADEGGWQTDYKAALKQAKQESKLVLADFTGSDWCPWCIKLHKEVFDTPEFKEWAAKRVVLLELDFPRKKELSDELKKQNADLRDKLGIKGYPTVVFFDAE